VVTLDGVEVQSGQSDVAQRGALAEYGEAAPLQHAAPASSRRSALDLALNLFADVRSGEARTALLITANLFLLLTAYYILKTVREPLIMTSGGTRIGGAEIKAFTSAGQAVLLVPVVIAYDYLSRRFGRMRLIAAVTIFFASNLVAFWALASFGVPYLGIAFFLWLGVFNYMIVAQTWSFANDVYDPEQGARLFAVVGIGASLGAVVGAQIAKVLFDPVGPYALMLVAAAMLLVCLLVMWRAHRREAHAERRRPADDPPVGRDNAFALIVRDRYLMLVAALTVLLNFVNTNGEYILDRTLQTVARADLAARHPHVSAAAGDALVGSFINGFRADFNSWVSIVSVVLQLFIVSRVLKYAGVRAALFVLPVIALCGYSVIAFAPILPAIMLTKVAENSTDYSLQNTARQTLFLITSRQAKYKSKAVIDSFLVRVGDVFSAGVVALGIALSFITTQFVVLNVILTLAWLAVVVATVKIHKQRAEAQHSPRRNS